MLEPSATSKVSKIVPCTFGLSLRMQSTVLLCCTDRASENCKHNRQPQKCTNTVIHSFQCSDHGAERANKHQYTLKFLRCVSFCGMSWLSPTCRTSNDELAVQGYEYLMPSMPAVTKCDHHHNLDYIRQYPCRFVCKLRGNHADRGRSASMIRVVRLVWAGGSFQAPMYPGCDK